MINALTQKLTARQWFVDVLLVTLASVFIGLIGQIAIRLPFTPVPIFLQNNAICLAGYLLGRKRGMAAAALFIAQGMMGLPVFANGGAGLAYLMGPTGGYIAGYIFSAYIAGYLAEKKEGAVSAFNALNIGLVAHYVTGCAYLTTFVEFPQSVLLGFAPFILGDLLVNVGLAKLGHRARSLLPQ